MIIHGGITFQLKFLKKTTKLFFINYFNKFTKEKSHIKNRESFLQGHQLKTKLLTFTYKKLLMNVSRKYRSK